MAQYTQKDRVFRVSVPSLGEDVLLLEEFSGEEHVSEPFELTVRMVSEDDSIDPSKVLREKMVISIRLADGSDRYLHGFCNRFTQHGKDEDLTTYQADVVPWLSFLSMNKDCKIFQEQTVLEIIEEVFSKYGNADYGFKCVESYPPREFCVQYQESDLDFVHRLMEEEGIYYFFQHSEDGHKLVLADDSSALEECPVQSALPFATSPDSWTDEDVITEFEREYQVYTNKVTLTDYDHLQPSLDLESSASDDEFEEHYDYPGKYSELSAGERYTRIMLEEKAASGEVVRGAGQCRAQRSGYKFDLSDHYRDDSNQTYFLLSVWHTGGGGGFRTGEEETHYSNQFECIPASVPFRPHRKTEKPFVRGTQTAEVVGPSGEEIYTEKHGRVKVQFHWDRVGQKDENSSCWVRVSHPWAGKGWGAVSIPRIGQEVIVEFLEGDPDRPIITGRVYNAEVAPPFALPDGGVVSGIKSNTHKGSGYNEVSMDDTAGKEKFTINGQYDMGTTVGNDSTVDVGNNRTTNIGVNDSLSVGADRSIDVGSNENHSVGADRTLDVGSNESVTVGSNKTDDIGADYSITAGANQTIDVGADQSTTAGANLSLDAGAALSATGGSEVSVSAPKISITGDAEVTISVGGSSIKIDPSGVQIAGPKVTIQGQALTEITGATVKLN